MRPLNANWRIAADELPQRLIDSETDTAFHLPGEDALAEFGDLLGEPVEPAEAAPCSAPFPLPALIPDDVKGTVELRLELDFGRLNAQNAELICEGVCGKGRVMIEDTPVAVFQNPKDGLLRVPLYRALHLGRRQTIRFCFEGSRPAGLGGGVNLRLVSYARLQDVFLIPDAEKQTVCLRATVCAMEGGSYLLRVFPACPDDPQPVYDVPLSLSSGKQQTVSRTFAFPVPRFSAGKPYAGGSVRLVLFAGMQHGTFQLGAVCDELTLSCGYSGSPAEYDIPLLHEECVQFDALMERLSPLRLSGVRLDAPAPDIFYRKMTLAGIGVFHPIVTDVMRERLARHACVSFGKAPLPRMRNLPVLDAWQLCGLTACPSIPPADLTPAELLWEAAGKEVDPQSPRIAATLLWLRAVCIRLRAEAARQGRFKGSLCASGVWQDEDVYAALKTALAPTHVSALPLRGAWFADSHFSASICAFTEEEGAYTVRASLEDENGAELASLECAKKGVLECRLPDSACVLTLFTSLSRESEIVEQSQIPVYVGVKGMLETAF